MRCGLPLQVYNSVILSNFVALSHITILWQNLCVTPQIHSSLFAVAAGNVQNFPFLTISYKWNHTAYSFLCLASFT